MNGLVTVGESLALVYSARIGGFDTVGDAERPGADLPALRGALASLEAEIAADHGEHDFSTILLPGAERTGE